MKYTSNIKPTGKLKAECNGKKLYCNGELYIKNKKGEWNRRY